MVSSETGDTVVTKLTSNPRRLKLLVNPPLFISKDPNMLRWSLRAIEFAILHATIAYEGKVQLLTALSHPEPCLLLAQLANRMLHDVQDELGTSPFE